MEKDLTREFVISLHFLSSLHVSQLLQTCQCVIAIRYFLLISVEIHVLRFNMVLYIIWEVRSHSRLCLEQGHQRSFSSARLLAKVEAETPKRGACYIDGVIIGASRRSHTCRTYCISGNGNTEWCGTI